MTLKENNLREIEGGRIVDSQVSTSARQIQTNGTSDRLCFFPGGLSAAVPALSCKSGSFGIHMFFRQLVACLTCSLPVIVYGSTSPKTSWHSGSGVHDPRFYKANCKQSCVLWCVDGIHQGVLVANRRSLTERPAQLLPVVHELLERLDAHLKAEEFYSGGCHG